MYKLLNERTKQKDGIALLVREFLRYKKRLIVIFICLIISTVASVLTPILLKYAIDDAIGKNDLNKLWLYSGIFLGLLIILGIMFNLQGRLTRELAQKIIYGIRNKIFAKLQELPMEFFNENKSGDIIQRLTGNVEGLNNFFSEGLVRLILTVFALVGFLTGMILLNTTLGLWVVISVTITIVYLAIQGVVLNKFTKKSLDSEALLASQLQETLNGFQIIKIYQKEKEFLAEFQAKNKRFYKSLLKTAFVSTLSDGIVPFIFSTTVVIVVLSALNLYTQHVMTQGDIIAYLTYLVSFYRRFDGISGLWSNIQTGIASATRINELLKAKTNITNIKDPYSPALDKIKGKIDFKHVTFSYKPQEVVLNDINLSVDPGQTIAMIGPTGGGKTSFVNLIARLYDVNSGEVILDDVNVKEWDLLSLRKSIGYLIQDAIFFTGTIFENLTYDNPGVTKEEAITALTKLGGESIIKELDKGIDTLVNADTQVLSGGQKQVLALTRLMLRNPKIIILDEATSNIDTKSEKIIQKAIETVRVGRTAFIIAHRLSTIFNADKIVLIQNNTIAESGTHDELIRKNGIYFNIYSKFIGK